MPKGTLFSGDFKKEVVERMRREKLSYRETAKLYHVSNHSSIIQKWERIYLEEGPEGLYVDRRGHASAASGTRKGRPPKLEKQVEEDLIAENQRLRAEVAYLKKLNALVLKEEQQNRKHK